MTITVRDIQHIANLVSKAKDAHIKARNFAAINHKGLACAWRKYRDDCMRSARSYKRQL